MKLSNPAPNKHRDTSQRDVVKTAEAEQLRTLERENQELKKANEILRQASAFSPWRNSTAKRSREGLHRHTSGDFRGQVDLQGAAGRPVEVLASYSPSGNTSFR